MSITHQASQWTAADSAKAQQIWDDYQTQHDVSDETGRAVGIDPITGRVWFGRSALEIRRQMEAEQNVTPLFFLRVGQEHYQRKGVRR